MEGAEGSVDPHEAVALLEAGATYLDVREQVEFDSGHVAGALHITLDELPARLAELPAGRLVVGCRSGVRSLQAIDQLGARAGDAINLSGGLRAWVAAGLEIVDANGQPGLVL